MFGRNSKPAPAPAQSGPSDKFAKAITWEQSINDIQARSERRAWTVVWLEAGVIAALAAVILVMMPLKENTPYVWMVDQETGRPDLMTAVDAQTLSLGEVNDRYWLTQYVQARETYDWHTLQKDYDTVAILSAADVAASYDRLFEGENALDRVNGSSVRETIHILSVVPTGNNIGTVRFRKTTQRVADGTPGSSRVWVATIGFDFRPNMMASESVKRVNPFGFVVTSYRADPEVAGGGQ